MGEALYRKYRSKKLDEIVGQEHITTTLANALKTGKISHAYLFTGPKGVGKTSIARILAYEVNGIPYADNTSQHLDIIEIDAASNRRIDEIRELRDKVHIAPTSSRYKVYIIDEVHMLTKEAFNALLKTLEEPPEHSIFILATTEVHKLPETIVSRTQRFSFKPVGRQKVVEHLRGIANNEKIDISNEALELLAEHGEGSFRDSISMLDQVRSAGKKIDIQTVQQAIGVPPSQSIEALANALLSRQPKELMAKLEDMYNAGFQAAQIAKSLSILLRQQILDNGTASESDLKLLHNLLSVPASSNPRALLELLLIETSIDVVAAPTKLPTNPPQSSAKTLPKSEIPPEAGESQDRKQKPDPKPTPSKKPNAAAKFDENTWKEILSSLKGSHNTLYGITRMAEPKIDGKALVLSFGFPFHQRRCNEKRNREQIQQTARQVTGLDIDVVCVVDKASKPLDVNITEPAMPDKPKSGTLESITSVFGGGEVLED